MSYIPYIISFLCLILAGLALKYGWKLGMRADAKGYEKYRKNHKQEDDK